MKNEQNLKSKTLSLTASLPPSRHPLIPTQEAKFLGKRQREIKMRFKECLSPISLTSLINVLYFWKQQALNQDLAIPLCTEHFSISIEIKLPFITTTLN